MARPREFDIDKALHKALHLFWEKGFDGASVTELADTMGIVRPSLQAAFGSKDELYRKTFDLYACEAMDFIVEALRQDTAVEVCRRYLVGFCNMLTNPTRPSGCYMIKGALSCGRGAEIARREVQARLKNYADMLEQRFRQLQRDDDLAKSVDAHALAGCVTTLGYGLAVHADTGATRADLYRLVESSLKNLF